MAAKKKSTNNDGDRGINKNGKIVGFTPIKAKPTEAFTAVGQKATGLAKPSTKDRFASTAKTPVVKPTSQLAGGTPLGTSFGINPLNKGQIIGAASTALGGTAAGKAFNIAKNSYALGKKVIHGSPEKGLKEIQPRTGSIARPDENVNFSWNPKTNKGTLGNNVSEYSRGGSAYVGKVKRNSIVPEDNPGVIVSNKPIKVVKEISDTRTGKFIQTIEDEIPGAKLKKIVDKVKSPAKKATVRRTSRNSPV